MNNFINLPFEIIRYILYDYNNVVDICCLDNSMTNKLLRPIWTNILNNIYPLFNYKHLSFKIPYIDVKNFFCHNNFIYVVGHYFNYYIIDTVTFASRLKYIPFRLCSDRIYILCDDKPCIYVYNVYNDDINILCYNLITEQVTDYNLNNSEILYSNINSLKINSRNCFYCHKMDNTTYIFDTKTNKYLRVSTELYNLISNVPNNQTESFYIKNKNMYLTNPYYSVLKFDLENNLSIHINDSIYDTIVFNANRAIMFIITGTFNIIINIIYYDYSNNTKYSVKKIIYLPRQYCFNGVIEKFAKSEIKYYYGTKYVAIVKPPAYYVDHRYICIIIDVEKDKNCFVLKCGIYYIHQYVLKTLYIVVDSKDKSKKSKIYINIYDKKTCKYLRSIKYETIPREIKEIKNQLYIVFTDHIEIIYISNL